jgi:hypothetical protein
MGGNKPKIAPVVMVTGLVAETVILAVTGWRGLMSRVTHRRNREKG